MTEALDRSMHSPHETHKSFLDYPGHNPVCSTEDNDYFEVMSVGPVFRQKKTNIYIYIIYIYQNPIIYIYIYIYIYETDVYTER